MKFSHSEINPVTGALERYYWDEQTETMTIRNTHDVTDIIEANKRRANASLDQRFGNEMMHSVAEIPLALVVKFKKDYNVDVFSDEPEHKLKLRKLLDSPDYRYLKTTTKRLWRPKKTNGSSAIRKTA
jgi:hypothetical protein